MCVLLPALSEQHVLVTSFVFHLYWHKCVREGVVFLGKFTCSEKKNDGWKFKDMFAWFVRLTSPQVAGCSASEDECQNGCGVC